ncbi:MAG: hypothetical protein MH825_17375 [Cyanobacteria bacterium]|nr:hypothetical protein [Cyanobacteriota bacterium]
MQRHQTEREFDLGTRGGDMALERTAHWGVIDSSEPGGAMGPARRLSVPKRVKVPAKGLEDMTTLLADAMGVAIADAQAKGRSLDEVLAEVLADDRLLEMHQRRLLGEAIVQIWNGGVIAAPNRD